MRPLAKGARREKSLSAISVNRTRTFVPVDCPIITLSLWLVTLEGEVVLGTAPVDILLRKEVLPHPWAPSITKLKILSLLGLGSRFVTERLTPNDCAAADCFFSSAGCLSGRVRAFLSSALYSSSALEFSLLIFAADDDDDALDLEDFLIITSALASSIFLFEAAMLSSSVL